MTEAPSSADRPDLTGDSDGRGVLVVLCGPSGVGKGTVVRRLLAMSDRARLSVSATTRAPRPGEIDGVHYLFVTDDQFDRLLAAGELLEWAEYAGNRYGTPRPAVERELGRGHDVLLEIEVQGALQIRERVAEALHVFLAPPSFAELERRLVSRGTEDPRTRELRLEVAREELEHRVRFDHVVTNDDVDRAAAEIVALIEDARRARPGS